MKYETPAVVIGAGMNSLNIIRSLGRHGVKVINITANRTDPSLRSKYSANYFVESLFGDYLIDNLIKLSKSLNVKPVLFCSSDIDVITVSKHKHLLSEHYHMVMSDYNIVETLMNKKLLYKFALENNVITPKTYFTSSKVEVEKIKDIITYPCIIKPEYHDEFWTKTILSKYGIKVFKISDRDDYINCFTKYEIADRPLIIQEWIEGEDSDVEFCLTYIDKSKQPIAVFTGKKIRQFPILTGSTSYAESKVMSDVSEKTLDMLSSAGCIGICSVEFKRSRLNNELYMVEPTIGRVDTQEGISICSGLDIPYFCYKDAIGENCETNNNFVEGIKWINEPLDILAIHELIKTKKCSLVDIIRSYKGNRCYGLLAKDDIRPFIHFVGQMIKKISKYLLKRIFARRAK